MDITIIRTRFLFTANSGLANPNTGNASVQAGIPQIIQIPSVRTGLKLITIQFWYCRNGCKHTTKEQLMLSNGLEFYWQRGMAAGTGIVKYYDCFRAALTGDTLSAGGFTIYDPTGKSAGSQPY